MVFANDLFYSTDSDYLYKPNCFCHLYVCHCINKIQLYYTHKYAYINVYVYMFLTHSVNKTYGCHVKSPQG